jgi:predicted alpha/beta hydrolase family esterase
MNARAPLLIAGLLSLSGCGIAVDYGKVPHSQYVADPRCAAMPDDAAARKDLPYFVVTSRLPDCRSPQLSLTNQRGDAVRYGRFGDPVDVKPAKGKKALIVPLGLESEAQWWGGLTEAANLRKGRVLIYVHGYRETFTSTSDDAAQIARLTGFDGPVIQYSWPSQGKLLSYAVDETNMYWDQRNFRRFLSKLAGQTWVKDIIIVSHSLGARLVIPAVEYVDRTSANADSSNISNIILAAPDIDREDFERDIAEDVLSARRVNNDRRITVYVSASDKALALSRTIHGYPRLGSPYCFNPFEAAELKAKGLPVRCYASKTKYDVAPEKSGFTVIDTSDVSASTTGHSDYLTSAPACLDFVDTVNGMRIRTAGRLPTDVSHVFRLPAFGKREKPDHKGVCKIR